MTRIAFIGTGGVATRHAECLTEVEGAEFAGAWSRRMDNVANFVKSHGGRAYASVDEILADPKVDAVAVLSLPDTHVDYALRALKAGKHVLVEKPVSLTADGYRQLIAAQKASGKVCMPVHNYVYAPEVQRMRVHLEAGKLGRFQSFWMIYNNRQPPEFGTPDFMMTDMMIHPAYVSLHFCGRPTKVMGVKSNVHFTAKGAEDQIGITLQYDSGVIAHLWASWAAEDWSRDPWTSTLKVFGSEGTATSGWDAIKNIHQPHAGWDDAAYWDSFMHVQRHFIDQCIGKGRKPLSTLQDGLDAFYIVDAVRRSIASERWEVPAFE